MFGILMLVDMVLFSFLAYRYKYVDDSKNKQEEIGLQETNRRSINEENWDKNAYKSVASMSQPIVTNYLQYTSKIRYKIMVVLCLYIT